MQGVPQGHTPGAHNLVWKDWESCAGLCQCDSKERDEFEEHQEELP